MKSYHFEEERKLVVTRYGTFQHATDEASKAAVIEVATFIPALKGRRSYTFEGIPGEWFLMSIAAALADQAEDDIPTVSIGPKGEQVLTWDPAKNYYLQPIKKDYTLVDESAYFDKVAEVNPDGKGIQEISRVLSQLKDPLNVKEEVAARISVEKGVTK